MFLMYDRDSSIAFLLMKTELWCNEREGGLYLYSPLAFYLFDFLMFSWFFFMLKKSFFFLFFFFCYFCQRSFISTRSMSLSFCYEQWETETVPNMRIINFVANLIMFLLLIYLEIIQLYFWFTIYIVTNIHYVGWIRVTDLTVTPSVIFFV